MKRLFAVFAALAVAATVLLPSPAALAGDADIVIGGPGTGNGRIGELSGMTFDPGGNLYVLDGWRYDRKAGRVFGNVLVQKFDSAGQFVTQFSFDSEDLWDAPPTRPSTRPASSASGPATQPAVRMLRHQPAGIVVDSSSNVYLSFPSLGQVRQFGPDGKLIRKIRLPGASAMCLRRADGAEDILAVCNVRTKGKPVPVAQLEVIDVRGNVLAPLKLSGTVVNVQAIATAPGGGVHVLADINTLYTFEGQGRLLATTGGGTNLRLGDGSELCSSLAADSRGNVYSLALGGGQVVRLDAELKTFALAGGAFHWYDPWSPRCLAVDPFGRVWVGTGGWDEGKGRNHWRPVIQRLGDDFLDPSRVGVRGGSGMLLGTSASVAPRLAYNVGYDLSPVTADFVVAPARRTLQAIDVKWNAYDTYKNRVGGGTFNLKLTDGAEARQEIKFTPPAFGWYVIECELIAPGENPERLTAVACDVGITPRWPNMPVLTGTIARGVADDCARQAFVGLKLAVAHPSAKDPQAMDKLQDVVDGARANGLTLLVQLNDTDEKFITDIVTRFKGPVKYWEIVNEPNFTYKASQYVEILKRVRPLIKRIDPDAQVLGPTVSGIAPAWLEQFFQAGGGELVDIVSVHDYQGQESIDPFHWPWAFGQMRKLMAADGAAGKPVWQTERGILGVRDTMFMGPTQAVRVMLHQNLLEAIGIPAEHSFYYYLNQAGYSSYPAYLWSSAGPHPGALALRTRAAMIEGKGPARRLDFGPTGNRIFLGLLYAGKDDQTVMLQNQGTADQDLELPVTGTDKGELVDAFGNSRELVAVGDKFAIKIGVMPVYLRLPATAVVKAPTIDFGRNVAPLADITYSAASKIGTGILTNGLYESAHTSDPQRGRFFVGTMPASPPSLTITFPHRRTVDRMIVWSMRADGAQSALLDYDLQYHDGTKWVALDAVRSACPPSDACNIGDCQSLTWYMDQNFFIHRFNPVTTDRLRIVARRTTLGALPDQAALKARGGSAEQSLQLREIEIYGPDDPPAIAVRMDSPRRTSPLADEPVTVTVTNPSADALEGSVRLKVPKGWTTDPQTADVKCAGGGSAKVAFKLTSPAPLNTGRVVIDAELTKPAAEKLAINTGESLAGKPMFIDFDRMAIEIAPPLELATPPPVKLDEAAQPIPLKIRNTTTAAMGGTVTLTLTSAIDPTVTRTAQKAFAPIAAGKEIDVELLVEHLPLLGQGWKAQYTVQAGGIIITRRQDLLPVRVWQIVGPFPRPIGQPDRDWIIPKSLDLATTYDLPDGSKLAWKTATNNTRGMVDLAGELKPFDGAQAKTAENVTAYAAIAIRSPNARKVLISLGWDDTARMWLNGKEVFRDDAEGHPAAADQVRVPVELTEGANTVLLRINQVKGAWGFYFDVLTEDGKTPTDLLVGK